MEQENKTKKNLEGLLFITVIITVAFQTVQAFVLPQGQPVPVFSELLSGICEFP